jgi:hypothetical protein
MILPSPRKAPTTERTMSSNNCEAEIAAFIRSRGITRCPTACVAPTQASGSAADRAVLQERAVHSEASRMERARLAWARAVAA